MSSVTLVVHSEVLVIVGVIHGYPWVFNSELFAFVSTVSPVYGYTVVCEVGSLVNKCSDSVPRKVFKEPVADPNCSGPCSFCSGNLSVTKRRSHDRKVCVLV